MNDIEQLRDMLRRFVDPRNWPTFRAALNGHIFNATSAVRESRLLLKQCYLCNEPVGVISPTFCDKCAHELSSVTQADIDSGVEELDRIFK